MAIHVSRARFAVIVAVVLALFVSGVVAGAAGSPLIIGGANQAGTSNTSLNTTSGGFAWQMNQLGSGVGVFAISQDGNALAALAHNGNKYGLSVTNDGAAGTGAAIIADGRNNVGVDIRTNGNGIDPIKVNSTGLVDNLNSDMVDYFHANSLGRVAFTSTENAGPDGADGTPLSVTINAPTRGYFSVVASVDSYSFTTSDQFNCQLNVNGNYLAGSIRYVSLVDNANEEQDCSTNGAVQTCGGDATFTLTTSGVGANTSFDAGSMTVTFTPFNGLGNQPSLIGCIIIPLSPQVKAEP